MKIAILDGSTVGEIADHKSLFPNTSFPKSGPDVTWLATNSCAEVVTFLAFDSATQTCDGVDPYLDSGKVYTRRVTDMTSDEQAAVVTAANTAAATRNRAERDRRIAETDYMALSDVSMSAEVTTYRQALRDITSHANWPNMSDSDWPTKPGDS